MSVGDYSNFVNLANSFWPSDESSHEDEIGRHKSIINADPPPIPHSYLVACDSLSLENEFYSLGLPILGLQPGDLLHPIASISSELQELRKVGVETETLHLVAHGEPGVIYLGDQKVNREALIEHRELISSWALSKIVIWSCEVGQDEDFISLLREFTNADVISTTQRLGLGNTLSETGWPQLEEMVSSLPFQLTFSGGNENISLAPVDSSLGSQPTGAYIQRDNSVYVVVDGPSWSTAQANANALGGDLVTINNAEENTWLHQTFNIGANSNMYWTGYSDDLVEGTWEWQSGESSAYTNWASGQPNNVNISAQYGENYMDIGLWGPNSDQWNDFPDVLVPGEGYYSEWLNHKGIAEINLTNDSPSFALAAAISGELTLDSATQSITAAYTEGTGPTILNDQIRIDSPTDTDFSGGSIEFSISTNGQNTDTLSLPDSGSIDETLNAVSLVGSSLFVGLGAGNGAAPVGAIDSTFDGTDGQNLRINLSNSFSNGDFSQGISGWDVVNGDIHLDGNFQLGGHPTPVDSTKPSGASFTDDSFSQSVTTTTDHQDSGDYSLKLDTGQGYSDSYGIIKGPAIISQSEVNLKEGDVVSFDWKALGTGDAYDAYGYLLESTTGNTITILDVTGAAGGVNYPSSGFEEKSVTIGSGEDGSYDFVFVAGSYDATGGKWLGGSLLIDDLSVTGDPSSQVSVTEEMVQSLVRGLQYSSSLAELSSAGTLSEDKQITITVQDAEGESDSVSYPLQILQSPDNDSLILEAAQTIAQSINGMPVVLSGGSGQDTLDYSNYGSAITVDFQTSSVAANTATGILNGVDDFENVVGSNYSDTVVTSSTDNNVVDTRGGSDTITSSGGSDVINGGADIDTVIIQSGSSQSASVSTIDANGASIVSTNGINSISISNTEILVGPDGQSDTLVDGTDNANAASTLTLTGSDSGELAYGSNALDVSGFENFDAEGGADTVVFQSTPDSGSLSGTVDGGTGSDTLDYSNFSSSNGVTVDLAASEATGTGSVENFENIKGSEFSDSLAGNSFANSIYGEGGDDEINGSGGNNALYGGDGNDSITSGDGNDIIYGNEGSDFITTSGGNNVIEGGASNDTITSGSGADSIVGGTGDDSITSGDGNDTIYGNDGSDFITTSGGNNVIEGGASNDTITSGSGDDSIHSGTGDNSITSGEGNDTIVGNDGIDTIFASGGDNEIDGGGSNDTISSGSGADSIVGGTGDDSITSGDGNDTIYGNDGSDFITTSAGDNLIVGGTGDDSITSGDGNDTIDGNDGIDTITASGGNNVIDGGASDDTITSGSGADSLVGGTGDDSLTSGAGDDTIYGNDGNDFITTSAGDNLIVGGTGDDSITSGDGNDTIDGNDGIDTITASGGNNVIDGGASNDTITSGSGADSIVGGTGDDLITSGDGNDTIYGNDGSDFIITSAGDNTIEGNEGSDQIDVTTEQGDKNLIRGGQTTSGVDLADTITVSGEGGDNTIYGNEGNDTITSSQSNGEHLIYGNSGQDSISITGSGGTNAIYGNEDSDDVVVIGASTTNSVYGGLGDDLLEISEDATGAVNTIDGGYGNDSIRMQQSGGSNTVYGGDGDDQIIALSDSISYIDGQSGADTIDVSSSSADNTLIGGSGSDSIDGGSGSEVIYGASTSTNASDGNDSIVAGDGEDTIYASIGDDTISGGSVVSDDSSSDSLSYDDEVEGLAISISGSDQGTVSADGNTVDLSSTDSQILDVATGRVSISNQSSTDWADDYVGIEKLVLTNQDDIVSFDASSGLMSSEAGADQLDAKGGFDVLDYSSFNEDQVVRANLSSAEVGFDINNSGVVGDDDAGRETTLTEVRTATRLNTNDLDAEDGGANAIVADSSSLDDSSIEGVIGGGADDVIAGDDKANLLVGNDGDDLIDGGGGNDTIYGGHGNEFIVPGAGSDLVYGGAGINTIRVSGADLSEDTFVIDSDGVNTFELFDEGGGADGDVNTIDIVGNFNPGAQGIDQVDGGEDVKSIDGDAADNFINLSGTALINIGSVSGGAGSDSIITSPTGKLVNTQYFGGDSEGTDASTDSDNLGITLTFEQIAALNSSGEYVSNLQNYLDNPNGKTFSSSVLPLSASGFESASYKVVAPSVFNNLQGDPIAITTNTVFGVDDVTTTAGEALEIGAQADANSIATASSVPHIVSSLVQANNVKGADELTATAGTELDLDLGADHQASASAATVEHRADAIAAAYGLGVDRSEGISGAAMTVNATGSVDASTTSGSKNMVVNADGVVEAAASRDSSFTAGTSLDVDAAGSATQSVAAENVSGLSTGNLTSRVYGIDDANVSDAAADGITAGSRLDLNVSAQGSNSASAQSVQQDDLGSFSLNDSGTSEEDKITTSLFGNDFPLIGGDVIRFKTTGGGVEAGRDYYVINPIANDTDSADPTVVFGSFQVATTPDGAAIEISADASLEAFRPAEVTADGLALATGVQLADGITAGSTFDAAIDASQSVTVSASSVNGGATAGLNRLGANDDLNTDAVSRVTGSETTSFVVGTDGTVSASAMLDGSVSSSSIEGRSEAELNGQVLGSTGSSTLAGESLSVQTSADLDLSGVASSVDGGSEARAGSGSGAGAGEMNPTGTASTASLAVPASETFAQAQALTGASQVAGTDLQLTGATTIKLDATATNVAGERELGSATSVGGLDYVEIANHRLANGDRLEVVTGSEGSSGLAADTEYHVLSVGFGAVTAGTSTIGWGDRNGDGTADLQLADGTGIRFGLNTTESFTDQGQRNGLDLGAQYYVVNGNADEFQVAATPGGTAIDLSADTTGQAEQLMALDYVQLATTASGVDAAGASTIVTLEDSDGDVTFSQASVATAFAGSRDVDGALSDTTAEMTTAMAWGIQGQGGQSTVLESGEVADVSAESVAEVNAMASNVDSDATAAAGIENQGMDFMAVTAGTSAVISATADSDGSAIAITIGDSADLDDAVSTLNLVSRGIRTGESDDDITVGSSGTIDAAASVDGSSTASTVKGDASALGDAESSAIRFDNAEDVEISIGTAADLDAMASVGLSGSPFLMEAIAEAEGDALATGASEAFGVLGTYDLVASDFNQVSAGSSADVDVSARSNVELNSSAVDGTATTLLESTQANATASDTQGWRDVELTAGTDVELDVLALGQSNLSATSIEQAASSIGATETQGIGTNAVDLAGVPEMIDLAGVPEMIDLIAGGQSSIAAIAQQNDFSEAMSVKGTAISDLTNNSTGLSNASIVGGSNGELHLEAESLVNSIARSSANNASA